MSDGCYALKWKWQPDNTKFRLRNRHNTYLKSFYLLVCNKMENINNKYEFYCTEEIGNKTYISFLE